MPAMRVPPGHAGRLWLRHRLATATHGADVLERKLRALRKQQRALLERRQAAEEAWRDAAGVARTWLLRAALLAGQRGLALADGGEAAQVDVAWTVTMGVRHPTDATCQIPPRAASEPAAASAALPHAEAAHRAATEAAVCLAALWAATRLLGAEITTTQQRVRALRRHWIPVLEDALARSELMLEEQEHEEWVRRRWAANRADRGAT